MIAVNMTTTGAAIEGFRTTRSLGIVRGVCVRSRSIFGTMLGALQSFIGGKNRILSREGERLRREAFEALLQNALEAGANAVVGVRYDTIGTRHITEVLCYGTAVVVEAIVP